MLVSRYPLHWTTIKELTTEETEAYLKAYKELHQVQNYLFVPRMAFENHEEFISVMQHRLERWVFRTQESHELIETTYLANKTLMNFLAAASFFTEFSQKEIKRKYGDPSPELEIYKTETATAYESFAYRFMQKFRNYAMHSQLAVGSVSIVDRPGSDELIRMKITHSASELLKDKGYWKPRLTKDLSAMNEIDLVPLATEYRVWLEKIDQVVQNILFPELADNASIIFRTVHDALEVEGTIITLESKPREDGKGEYHDIRYPPLKLLAELGFEHIY